MVSHTMRPPKERQNSLLQPLNEIFGTEANVRLLRVLALQNSSLSAGELAIRARLGRTSIYPALRELERVGIVEFVGTGARRLVQLRERHPLSQSLRELFRIEANRFDALAISLRELLAKLPHPPISAWLDRGEERFENNDALDLYVVARPEDLNSLTDYLNNYLALVERTHDVHIAVHGLLKSELETLNRTSPATLSRVVLLGGVPPSALLQGSRPAADKSVFVSHAEHDVRSLRLAIAIAEKIKRDPGLIAVAEDRVKRRAHEASSQERRELMEWARILSTMSPARLRKFLLENSERAIRLRQTLPALNLLSAVERDAVMRSQTVADVIAAIKPR